MRRCGWLLTGVLVAVTVAGAGGCEAGGEPGNATLPPSPTPCASWTPHGSPPPPSETRLAYRAEEMADGSIHMTVGDVDAAPENPDAVAAVDHRAPASVVDCETVRIETVEGWWCTTTVEPVAVEGEIVVGGAEPRARIGADGFATRCHGRLPGRLRQVHEIQRDSWSGWRPYTEEAYTEWTGRRRQREGAVSEPCPRGRVGTYDYRLAVRVEVEGMTVGESLAASAPIRTDCGTGVS
ncbi:hypothetical protein ACTWP5_20370 [Streptomyces sp. 4N509B]|uniref:hypothetical protein n=1 Tax=Streptomyces sp. 4N509B TaxID=3457413 RepID=UPI003FCFD5FF